MKLKRGLLSILAVLVFTGFLCAGPPPKYEPWMNLRNMPTSIRVDPEAPQQNAFNYTFPTLGTPAGFTDGTSMQAATVKRINGAYYLGVAVVDASGNQVTSFGGGTGSGDTQYTNGAAIGTGTGTISHGSVTTSAPSYSNGTVAPLSLTTGGLLRVDGNGGTFAVSQSTATNLKTQAEAYQGGSAVAAANGLYVQPGTSASFTVAQSTAANLKATVTPVDSGGGDMTNTTAHGINAVLFNGTTATSETNPIYTRQVNSLASYVTKPSNGVTDVELVAADANNYIEVAAVFVTNTNTTTGTSVKLCDGTCSTSNYILIPAPSAQLSGNTAGAIGMLPPGFAFRTSAKNHAIDFALSDALTTTVTVSILYRKVGN